MKVVKPNEISVITRCFENQRRLFLGISAIAFVPIDRAELSLIPEAELWKFVPERVPGGALDEGMPKSRAEFLVDGWAFVPGGAPVGVCKVGVRVGTVVKQLVVSGDRVWKGNTPSNPQPFAQLRLGWERAYGGPSYARNPGGIGADEQVIEGFVGRLLPNIEAEHQLVTSPSSQPPEPAGFGVVDISWPQRSRLAGTYDQAWLETDFPGLARDADWAIFNVAPRDQWGPQTWPDGVELECRNLHPHKPHIQARLPALRMRCMLTRQAEPPTLEDVGLHLQTLWLFPDVERVAMIFHGSTRVARDDAGDIHHLVLAAERPDAPRGLAHYQDVLERRLDKQTGAIASLADDELLPADHVEFVAEPPPGTPKRAEDEGLLQANLHRKAEREVATARQRIEAFGLDPDLHGPLPPDPPTKPPAPRDLPKLVDEMMAKTEAKRIEQEAIMEARKLEIFAMVDALEIPGFDSKVLAAELTPPTGPPRYSAQAQVDGVAKLAQEARDAGQPIDELEHMLVDNELQQGWRDAETKMRESYRLTAHVQDPAAPLDDEASAAARARLQAQLDAGADMQFANFTGADLRGLDLRGAKLAGVWFESVVLAGVDLSGAMLDAAVLAHADLRGAKLDGASLIGANLGAGDLREASLRQAKLGDALLSKAKLDAAVLDGAELEAANLMEASVAGCSAREVEAKGFIALDTPLVGIDFGGANLEDAHFIEADLADVSFAGANLRGVTFVGCKAAGVDFSGACLDGARFVKGCDLSGACFARASLAACNLRETKLAGADFSEAMLDAADLSESDLSGANFYRAVLRDAMLAKANAAGASFLAANLMQVIMTGTDIRGVDLRGANLYAADMSRVWSDAEVRLDDANLTKVRVYPRREDPSDQEPSGHV